VPTIPFASREAKSDNVDEAVEHQTLLCAIAESYGSLACEPPHRLQLALSTLTFRLPMIVQGTRAMN